MGFINCVGWRVPWTGGDTWASQTIISSAKNDIYIYTIYIHYIYIYYIYILYIYTIYIYIYIRDWSFWGWRSSFLNLTFLFNKPWKIRYQRCRTCKSAPRSSSRWTSMRNKRMKGKTGKKQKRREPREGSKTLQVLSPNISRWRGLLPI